MSEAQILLAHCKPYFLDLRYNLNNYLKTIKCNQKFCKKSRNPKQNSKKSSNHSEVLYFHKN